MDEAHSHEREIIADNNNPVKCFLRQCGRALRLAKKLANEPSWTVWKQAELAQVAHSRISKLAVLPEFSCKCPCGRTKTTSLQMAKIDAAQFFKNASTKRGHRRAFDFLARVSEKNDKHSAVAIRRSTKADGFFCRFTKPNTSEHSAVHFSWILSLPVLHY